MDKVILSDDLLSQLTGEAGSVELYDKAGRSVGYFLSADEYQKLIRDWALAEFAKDDLENPIDDNDETGSMTTPELLDLPQVVGLSRGQRSVSFTVKWHRRATRNWPTPTLRRRTPDEGRP